LAIAAPLLLAGCGANPDTGLSPTTVASAPADAGLQQAVFASADLAGCLAGVAWSGCFSADRIQTASVISAPVASAPLNLTASISGNTVMLAWVAPATQDAPVTSYAIEVGSAPNFAVPNLANINTDGAATGLTAPGVPAGTYYVRVRARNALGLGSPSNEVQVVVGGSPGLCPGAPRSLTVTRTASAVTLTWLPPLAGIVQSYLVEAGSAPGLGDRARVNVGTAGVTFPAATVPVGTYYIRVYAQTTGCPTSPPSNEAQLVVPGATGGNPTVTLRLSYTCSPCVGDPDNYALNVACVRGRCSIFRTSNPFRSPNVITASLRLAPGTHETEVVVRNPAAPWNLTITGTPGGGVEPGSFVLLDPPGAALSFGPCSVSGRTPEAVFTFRVRLGGPGTVC
jgi:hypothetical protein